MPKFALVTGGSSGIGLAIAQRLQEKGFSPLLLSHDFAELEGAGQRLGLGRESLVCCDLAEGDQRRGLWDRLEASHGPMDLLVNNAGIGHHGEILQLSEDVLRRVMEVNFFAPVDLCRQALAAMGTRRRGQILNLTSASARRPLARMGAYGSSKAALHGFTQSLRMEARAYGVQVSEVLPISVQTAFFERASNTSPQAYRARGRVQTPEQVAEVVMKVLEGDIPERVTHWPTALALGLEALLPNWVARALNYWEGRSKKE